MTALDQAYRDHGMRMIENNAFRYNLYRKMKDSYTANIEKQLCFIDVDDSVPEPTGILRFFEYHLWTHEPRIYIREKYHPEFSKYPRLPFMLFNYQKQSVMKICECINSGKNILVEKSRDMGVTWEIVGGIALWYWLREQSGSDILLGSSKFDYVDKKGAVDTLFEKFRYNLYNLDKVFIPKGFETNKHDNVGFILNPYNGNFIKGEANNPKFGTSGRYLFIFVDEFSKWEETDEQAWTAMCDSSLCKIVVSTPWGMGRKFAQLRFSGAIEVLTYHWSDHPIKGAGKYRGQHPIFKDKKDVWLSEWYLAECERRKDNPKANIGQELDIDHITSGTPYFNNDIIQERYLNFIEPEVKSYVVVRKDINSIDIIEDMYGSLKIVEEPEDGWLYRYCIAMDCAEGLERGDNSVLYVFDRLKLKDVAYFAGKIDSTVFALLGVYLGYKYNEAYIAPENNKEGHHVVQRMKELYTNIMNEMDFSKVVDLDKVQLGWNTNVATRPLMLGELRDVINNNKDGIIDRQFYQECLRFVYNKNGKAEADSSYNDDRVMAQAIKWQIHKWLPAPIEVKTDSTPKYSVERFGGINVGEKRDIRKIW